MLRKPGPQTKLLVKRSPYPVTKVGLGFPSHCHSVHALSPEEKANTGSPWDSSTLTLSRGSQTEHKILLLETTSGSRGFFFPFSMGNKIVLVLGHVSSSQLVTHRESPLTPNTSWVTVEHGWDPVHIPVPPLRRG